MSLTRHILLKVQRHKNTHRSKLSFGVKILAVIFVSVALCLFITSRYSQGRYSSDYQRLKDFDQFVVSMKTHEKKMVFIETTEREDFCPTLRQSCAVESAARTNPEAAVVLLLRASSISEDCAAIEELENLFNVEIVRYTIDEVLEGTPLLEWGQRVQSGEVRSTYMRAHLSDALRLAVVHKYSAIYLDLDFIVLRSFDQFFAYKGFLARESESDLNGALIGFQALKNFTADAMIDFSLTYRGDDWAFNGPALMRRVIEKWGCRTSDVFCKGVTILNPIAFYPVHFGSAEQLFEDESYDLSLDLLNDEEIFAVHFWNSLTYNTSSPVQHTNVLNVCGKMKCPATFQLVTQTQERNFM